MQRLGSTFRDKETVIPSRPQAKPRTREGSAVSGEHQTACDRRKIISPVFTFCVLSVLSITVHAADSRFQWSSERFAAQCGFKPEDYSKAAMKLFTDRNYSDKWNEISAAKLKTCLDCYRFAEVAKVGSMRVVRLSMGSESGDWLHETYYCFDAGGRLRGMHSVFNCAWGWSYVRVFSFENGSLSPVVSRWQDLKSGQETSTPGTADDMKDHWSDIPIYKLFPELPFAKLMTN